MLNKPALECWCGKDPWQVLAVSALSYFCVSLFRASTEAAAAIGAVDDGNVGSFLGWQGREKMLGWVVCCRRR